MSNRPAVLETGVLKEEYETEPDAFVVVNSSVGRLKGDSLAALADGFL